MDIVVSDSATFSIEVKEEPPCLRSHIIHPTPAFTTIIAKWHHKGRIKKLYGFKDTISEEKIA
jgi:hypothetical protein